MNPIQIPWDKAVKVETRDGLRKGEAVRVDWLVPGRGGAFPRVTGTLPDRFETKKEIVRIKRDPEDVARELAVRAKRSDTSEIDLYVKPVEMDVKRCVSEGGTVSVTQGDWFVKAEGGVFAVTAAEWGHEWIDPVAEAARVAAIKAKAEAERKAKEAAEAKEEADRIARTEAEAKRILEAKEDIVIVDGSLVRELDKRIEGGGK